MELHVKGHAAYAYTGGRPHQADQPCVVFLHGAGNDHSVWALQSRYLAHHGHAVLCPDLPGHGRSGGKRVYLRDISEYTDDFPLGVVQWHFGGAQPKGAAIRGGLWLVIIQLGCAGGHDALVIGAIQRRLIRPAHGKIVPPQQFLRAVFTCVPCK